MSVKRCVAALTGLSGELDRVETNGDARPSSGDARATNGGASLTAMPPRSLRALIQDLALDVDLRHETAAQSLMSEIESEVYLPLIEKVLTLLRLVHAGDSSVQPVMEAKELTQSALRIAAQRATQGIA
jgi:hypothetical protein